MKKKICLIFILSVIMIALMNNFSFAVDTGAYKGVGATLGGGDMISKAGGYVFNAVRIVGAGIAVIYITILSIKYMTSAVDGKADIKKKLIPFVIGAALVFGVTYVIELIFDISTWFNGQSK